MTDFFAGRELSAWLSALRFPLTLFKTPAKLATVTDASGSSFMDFNMTLRANQQTTGLCTDSERKRMQEQEDG